MILYVFRSLTCLWAWQQIWASFQSGRGECWDRPTCRGPAPHLSSATVVDPPKCRCVWTWPRQNDSFPKRRSCFLLRETSWNTIENHHLTTINIIADKRETRKVCRSCNDSLPVRFTRRCRNGMISESRLKSPSRQHDSVVITWNHPGSTKGESMWNHGTPVLYVLVLYDNAIPCTFCRGGAGSTQGRRWCSFDSLLCFEYWQCRLY